MNEPPRMPPLLCRRCGAANPPYAKVCWLCSTGDRTESNLASALIPFTEFENDPARMRSLSRTQQFCAGLLVACVVLTLLVVIGFAIQDRGMLIPLLIVVGPAYLATGLRALHDFATDKQLKASSLLLTFLFSGLFGVLALALFIVASCIAFFVWCLSQLS
jgi:hypothetical protein